MSEIIDEQMMKTNVASFVEDCINDVSLKNVLLENKILPPIEDYKRCREDFDFWKEHYYGGMIPKQ